jgi:hypothetical protein
MSGHPQGGHYDDGYGHQGQDSYYHDDQYGQYDQQHGGQQYHDNQHGDAYYDESAYYDNNHNNQQGGHYQQDGYYDERGQQGYQDEYYNDQYYDQGGAQGGYGQNGYGFVSHTLPVLPYANATSVPSPDVVAMTLRTTPRPSATSLCDPTWLVPPTWTTTDVAMRDTTAMARA